MDYEENNYDSEEELDENDLFCNNEAEEVPESPSNSGKEEDNNKIEKDNEESEKKKDKPKRRVLNPRITLNFDRLSGPNGLSALKKLFSNFKFKGNNHEEEDLAKIMGILQQWMCYQLFPSYDFETCMMQLENIGRKKKVQTLMKKYRLGMDDWGEKKSDCENDGAGNEMEVQEEAGQEKFDALLDCEIAGIDIENDFDLSDYEVDSKETNVNDLQQSQPLAEIMLTQEQLERIARNKKLAEERRLKKMNFQQENFKINDQQNVEAELLITDTSVNENS